MIIKCGKLFYSRKTLANGAISRATAAHPSPESPTPGTITTAGSPAARVCPDPLRKIFWDPTETSSDTSPLPHWLSTDMAVRRSLQRAAVSSNGRKIYLHNKPGYESRPLNHVPTMVTSAIGNLAFQEKHLYNSCPTDDNGGLKRGVYQ